MLGERLARGAPALERLHRRGMRRSLGDELILGGVGLQIFELHLHLLEQLGLALRTAAIEFAPELLDLQLQPRDQRLRPGIDRRRTGGKGLGLDACGSLREDHRMRGCEVGRERFSVGHTAMESYPPTCARPKSLAGRRRPPGLLRHAPVDTFEQIAELCRRDGDHAVGR